MTDITERVRALIAKAESSPFPAEADAFMVKAQQLIDTHAIDEARLHGADPGSIGHETMRVVGAYSRERALIWGAVAIANRCRVLTLSRYGSSRVDDLTLIGREQDRRLVRLLAGSLELQAMRRMAELDTGRTRATPVVQRRSFLRGFAGEVATRLRRPDRHAEPTPHAARQALMLAADAVDRYVDDHFALGRGRRSQVRHDGAAYSLGRRAGATADVGATRLGSSRGRLPPASG